MALNDPHRTSGDEPAIVHGTSGGVPHDAELLAAAELLPCGRSLGHVWEQARDRAGAADPHYSRCPQCREAIEGLTALDRAARALRAEEQPDSRSLANRVINAVRAEVRLGTMLLLDDPQGDLRIAESAAAKVLRRAADTVAGARAASCRLIPTPPVLQSTPSPSRFRPRSTSRCERWPQQCAGPSCSQPSRPSVSPSPQSTWKSTRCWSSTGCRTPPSGSGGGNDEYLSPRSHPADRSHSSPRRSRRHSPPAHARRPAGPRSITHASQRDGRSDVHREAGRIRCEHMPRGGWQVEVRCILQADNRIVDIARQAREEVRAAVTASLSQHGAVGPITVLVTVTRTIRGTT